MSELRQPRAARFAERQGERTFEALENEKATAAANTTAAPVNIGIALIVIVDIVGTARFSAWTLGVGVVEEKVLPLQRVALRREKHQRSGRVVSAHRVLSDHRFMLSDRRRIAC
jgi:hypothetical protein